MKKFINIAAAALLLAAISCDRELDVKQLGAPNQTNYWKTESDLTQATNALYSLFGESPGDTEFYSRGMFWFINASDDMVTGRPNGQADNIKNFSSSYEGGGYTEPQWKARYTIIKGANDILTHAAAISASDAVKNRCMGEAYFLSALMYFQLASNYGNDKMGVPILPRTADYDGTFQPRASSVTENYNYIISDLQKAADLLPNFTQMAATDYGHAHKVAAWALMSKVYLFMKDYKNAEIWATKVITDGGRSLQPNFADIFKAENNWGGEYIWSAVSNVTAMHGSYLSGVMLDYKGWGEYNGWGYFAPTKELYDEFEPGDKRREVTILKEGDNFQFNGHAMVFHSQDIKATGFMFNKYMDPYKYKIDGSHVNPDPNHMITDLNLPLMRYAEVILIDAEAKLMQGKNADADINLIRKRAGLAPKTGCTMADLKHERRCELAGEWADRHRDLVRWGDAQVAYAKPLHNLDGSVAWPSRNYNPDIHNVWAVPQQEITNSNGVIKQNAGW